MINSFAPRLMQESGPPRVRAGASAATALDISLPDAKYSEIYRNESEKSARQIRERLLGIPGVKVGRHHLYGLPFGTMLNIGTRVSGEGAFAGGSGGEIHWGGVAHGQPGLFQDDEYSAAERTGVCPSGQRQFDAGGDGQRRARPPAVSGRKSGGKENQRAFVNHEPRFQHQLV